MPTAPNPNAVDMASREAFRTYVLQNQQQGVYRGTRSTLSMNGSRQLNVTAQSLSDIMQGTMSVRGPEELSLIINKALTNNLDFLYESDYKSISAFSTAKYEFAKGHWPNMPIDGAADPNTPLAPPGLGVPIEGVDISVYSPPSSGYDSVEGGVASSRDGMDGKSLVRTLDDVRAGTSNFLTLAGDPSFYKKQYTIPTITYHSYKSGSQEVVTLTNVTAYVHDTGSAFIGKPEGRYDLPVGFDYTGSQQASQPYNNHGPPKTDPKIQLIPPGTGGGGTKTAFTFLKYALSQVGDPYSTAQNQGATVPLIPNPTEFDCSNLIYWAAVQAGFPADWPTRGEWAESKTIQDIFKAEGTTLTRDQAKSTAGAIFTRQPPNQAVGQGSHSAISLGNGALLESTGGAGVGVNPLGNKFPASAAGTVAGYIPGMTFTGPITGLPTGGGTSVDAVNSSRKATGGSLPGTTGTEQAMPPIP